ncbi:MULTISPECIES: ABC transporter ATP-binding protein [unclassified Pseudarthrobacter]|uniref:ABC transporter ATP-binding protein n=1 Tax=unclassified Pseudarthrobacter TaxID=2647000 RepID=UPI00249A1402|nr:MULTISPECIES: ABC transporter ATP-binding protein [unclassified Pseudarthrobacter]MDI3195061.1 ABC transporter ATP-binding protein [Pseudarthrobacter sp. AL20]
MLFGLMARLLAGHKGAVAAIAALQLVQTAGNLLLPTVNAAIIDDGIVAGNTPEIFRLGTVMVLIAAVQASAAIAAGYFGAVVAMKIGHQLRAEVFSRIQSLSSQEVAAFGTQSLVTRATNDTQQIQSFAVLVFTTLVAAPVMAAGGVLLAWQQDIVLSSVVIAIMPILLLIMYLIVRRLVPLYRQGQELLDRTGELLRELIIGANVIRSFVRQGHETRRFAKTNSSLTGNNLQSSLLVAGMLPLIMIVVNLSSVAVVWFGGHRVYDGGMNIGALTAFIAYILQILLAIMMAMYVFMTAPRAAACAERLGAVLNAKPSVQDHQMFRGTGHGSPLEGGSVTFRNVSFSYPGAENPVLEDISFTARPGTIVAIVGSTGSGKSTLLSLVPRFVDSTAGTVSIGGRNICSMPLDVLRRTMAVVPQRSHLFSGTIADNLRVAAPQASDGQLWEAMETAQAASFVRALPLGMDTEVGQGGTTLSGGQRQRLCIARALLRRVPVYLFDDSFSALDFATEARVRDALELALRGAVVIVVAERISTVAGAGQILVLDDGRLVAEGTHLQLLETSATYREIAGSQLALDSAP